ncbi:MAG: phosphatidylserine decarboxylase family protein [Deltaproteobacteria bacterium]|nr:phosphatidylserine decarboxylase family protein [Deltaproteobacteria bacterium]
MRIAKAGYPLILTAGFLSLLVLFLGWTAPATVFALLALAFLGFFRDPERVSPPGEGLILSPADGKVVGIKQFDDGEVSDAARRVSIFLSPLDVHVNRSPIQGEVKEITYQKGGFIPAYRDAASGGNERNALTIVDAKGRKVGVVQIAGIVARRIVCYVNIGDFLERGQRFGLIMFGSRVDLFLPKGAQVEIGEGQRVKGGVTVIGRFA